MSTAPCTKLNFSNAVHRTSPPPYYPGLLYGVENVEMYRPGGFHLVRIGDVFCSGRYKVLHKLGHGGTSTVWLARDQSRAVERTPGSGPLVSLKIMSAEKSREYETQNADFYISNALRKRYEASHHPGGAICRFFWDQFAHEGPNGSHLCLVSEFTGPSLGTVGSWGPSAEFRRLQVDVGKKVAAQVALAVEFLHSAGVVHGDLTSSNILFRLTDAVQRWTDDDVYANLGPCGAHDIKTANGPLHLVSHISPFRFARRRLLLDDVVVIDFGQSFFVDHKPATYVPATQLDFLAPETCFATEVGLASDIWALACVFFEIKAGYAPFEDWLGTTDTTLKEMTRVLGKFPEQWWNAWEGRSQWFEESGEVKQDLDAKHAFKLTSIRDSLHEIGRDVWHRAKDVDYDMLQKLRTPLMEVEIKLLGDLLENMFRYSPQERLMIAEVVRHPWFRYKQ